MFPIQASPDNRYLFRIGLGDAFISGKVVLANDKPALNRMVYLWSTANPTSPFQWTLSEPDGSFRFAWLPEGEYRVEAVSFAYDGLYRMDRNESAQNSQTVKSGQSNLELRLPSE
jgi:hypothetical protein